jgi:hypothetical protein
VQSQQQVFHQCVDVPTGKICIDITSQMCFELTGKITMDGQTIFGPQSIHIGDLLNVIQRRVDDPNFNSSDHMICQPVTSKASPIGFCTLCATVDQLHINGNTLHYCGSGLLNCSGLLGPSVSRNFTIPCLDITNCQLFSCRNNCNRAGECTSVGICRCNEGYYGYDCSVQLDSHCASSPSIPSTCWTTDFPDCRTVDLSITRSGHTQTQRYDLEHVEPVTVVPCTSFFSENIECELCIDMTDINVQGTKLIGCPNIKTTCNSMLVSDSPINCVTLGESEKLLCPTPPGRMNNTDLFGSSRTGKTILLVLAVIVALVFLLGTGYVILTKFFGIYLPNPFDQGQPEVYIEDEAPLNGNDDDDDLEEDM